MQLAKATEIAERIKAELAPYCLRIEIAGSVRRKRPEVKDIEMVVIRSGPELIEFVHTVNKWPKVKGDALGRYTQRRLPDGIALDLFMCKPENWGLIYAIRTGSADYSRLVLAGGWVKKGFHSEDGVIRDPAGNKIEVREEEDLFRLIGIPWVPPEEREV